MGLIQSLGEAVSRQHTPKVAFVSPQRNTNLQAAGRLPKMILIYVFVLYHGQVTPRHDGYCCGSHRFGGCNTGYPGQSGGRRRPTNPCPFWTSLGDLKRWRRSQHGKRPVGRQERMMSRSARVLMEGLVRVPGDSF